MLHQQPAQLARNVGFGVFQGCFAAIFLCVIVFLADTFDHDPTFRAAPLYLSYPLGGIGTGVLGGLLRPRLHKLLPQFVLCFCVGFALYIGIPYAHGSFTGHPVLDAVIIGAFAAPIWVWVGRQKALFPAAPSEWWVVGREEG